MDRAANPRFTEIEGLRAIAALGVLVFHVGTVGGAAGTLGWWRPAMFLNAGVTVFFVISGFVLYRPYVAARARSRPAPSWRTFARRRLLRIVPAYWLLLTICLVGPFAIHMGADTWARLYLLVQNYSLDFGEGGLGPAWTLCVELSFYAVLPVYAALVRRLGFGRELIVLAVLAAASVALRLPGGPAPALSTLSVTLPGLFSWFALGMGLAVASVAAENGVWRPRERLTRLAWPGAALVFAAVVIWVPPLGGVSDYGALPHVLLGVAALLLVAPAVFGSPLPRRVLTLGPLQWLGMVSYGVYLWHEPLLTQVHLLAAPVLGGPGVFPLAVLAAAGTALTIVFAGASYYLVERRCMALGRRARRHGPPADEPLPSTA